LERLKFELRGLAVDDRDVVERLRRDGWQVCFDTPKPVLSVVHPPAGWGWFKPDSVVDPAQPFTSERLDFEYQRFALHRGVVIPLSLLSEAKGCAERAGVDARWDARELFRMGRMGRAVRDPGMARRVLHQQGWSNSRIKRIPIGRLRHVAIRALPVVLRLVVEAVFTIVDVPGFPRQIVFHAKPPHRIVGFVLAEHAIASGKQFRVGDA
jgi:hypothetical protein